MVIPLYVLLTFKIGPFVFHRLVGLEIRGICFPCPDITAVALVLNNAINGAGIPYFVTQFGGPSIAGK